MTDRTFYIEQLQINYWGLKDLIQKSEAPKDIKSLLKNEKFMQRPSKETPYFNRWNIVWITLTHPFYSVLSIFSSAMALLSYCLFIPSAARAFSVLSKQLTRDWQQVCSQWEFKAPLLTPSMNTHQLSSWDLYQWGDVSYNSIQDEMVKRLTFQESEFREGVKEAMDAFYAELENNRSEQSWLGWIWNCRRVLRSGERLATTNQVLGQFKVSRKKEEIELAIRILQSEYQRGNDLERPIQAFYRKIREVKQRVKMIPNISLFSDRGNCRGGSLWFIYLYHKTRHHFTDPCKHLEAVAQQFTSGMPRQAALLQAFNNSDNLLKMQREEYSDSTISLYELDELEDNKPTAKEKIQDLPVGIYRVGTNNHSLVYIKGKNEDFVWDPEFGLYAMGPAELLTSIKKHYHREGHPESIIYFHRYASAEG